MKTGDLFMGSAAPALDEPPPPPPPLYPYQVEAVEAVRRELVENRGTLVWLATGLGKTQVACELIRTWGGRCLFLAHRDELIQQAAKRIDQFTGAWPEIEEADLRASPDGDGHVVASIQTLHRDSRLNRFDRDAFAMIVVDEVHHAVARTYRKTLDYFEGAKIVGLTATPDRSDNEALGQVLDSVAYTYDITQAIDDGWLAPVVIKTVAVDAIDFSDLHTVAGEFNQGELDELMSRESALHGVAKPTVELAGERPTIVFTTSIDNAKRLAEVIDRYAGPNSAVAVYSGQGDGRREALGLYERRERQFLVNVAVATEGYDYPPTSCVVMGRPTKSRALYVQMLGRGTRGGPNRPIEGKTDCLVLDFRGNADRHDVVTAVDALGGDTNDQGIAAVKRELAEADHPMSFEEAIERARQRYREQLAAERAAAERRKNVTAQVAYRTHDPNPFVAMGVRRDYGAERYGWKAETPRQRAALQKFMGKHAKDLPANLSFQESRRLLASFIERVKSGRATYSQVKLLAKYGIDAKEMPIKGASAVIDAIAANRWVELPRSRVDEILRGA